MATVIIQKVLANYENSLASKMTNVATTLTLTTSTDPDGNTLSGTYLLTLDEGTNVEEHMTVTLAGTAGTVVRRGLSKVDGNTEVTANKFEHRRAASVKITTMALLQHNRLLNGDDTFNSVAWTGVASIAGLSTPTSGETTKVANVAYVNAIAVAGAPDASTTVKGIVEIATDAELQAGTGTGGTGAKLVSAGDSFTQTPTANKVPVSNSSGKLPAGWGGSASGLATLDGSSLVVQNPANATATASASKIPIADGSGYLNTWINTSTLTPPSQTQSALVAGENITAGNAVVVGDGLQYLLSDGSGNNTSTTAISTTQWVAYFFTTSSTAVSIHSVVLGVFATGSVAGTITASIRVVSGSAPSGSDMGSGTVGFNYVGSGNDTRTVTFSSPISVSPSTQYAVVIRDDIAGLTMRDNNTSNGNTLSTNSGSTWGTGRTFYVSVYEIYTVAGKLYKSNASISSAKANNFIGFAAETQSSGASCKVNNSGVDAGQSGLTSGLTYYLSNSAGAIASSAGTVSKKVGLSLSSTSILIKHDNT